VRLGGALLGGSLRAACVPRGGSEYSVRGAASDSTEEFAEGVGDV
jgi:hypothetical protein